VPSRRFHAILLAIICSSLLFLTLSNRLFAVDAGQAVLQADHAFVQAVAKADTAKLTSLLDKDFTWCDSSGKIFSLADVLHSVPKGSLGDETGAELKQLTYAGVGAVMAGRDKVQILRMWVKRPAGWRLLVYHEVHLSDHPPAEGGTGVKECENPCKSVPYQPKNEAEHAVIVSWQALETGVTNHDAAAWSPHIAEEFVMLNSNNDHPFGKADRIAILNKQKQSGVASAPSPLVSAQMFDFGDAIVMTCLHKTHTGKSVHVSRLWIKRDGNWVMAISYQTLIQGDASQSD
jgi:ketosteroid isomerase-like protein